MFRGGDNRESVQQENRKKTLGSPCQSAPRWLECVVDELSALAVNFSLGTVIIVSASGTSLGESIEVLVVGRECTTSTRSIPV